MANLESTMAEVRNKHKLPGLAAAAYVGARNYAACALGQRRIGEREDVTIYDKWHIGSLTKSMTATVAARLVEQDKIKWTTTVEESFPEWKSEMLAPWHKVTLEQLLSHTGGAPHEPPEDIWDETFNQRKGTPRAQRERFVHELLLRHTELEPGTHFLYSNQGYSIAGAMMERATSCNWEDLMQEMLFRPLSMTSAGFHAPGDLDSLSQPRGHRRHDDDSLQALEPDWQADNPAAIGPGGIVHCSIFDLVNYAAVHADQGHPSRKILTEQSWQKLHTPHPVPGNEYALGLAKCDREWGGGGVFMHEGSNNYWFAVMWIAPQKRAAYAIASNCAGTPSAQGCDEIAAYLVTNTGYLG
jgi:CubicO group peptidase (beta-lactamase class C family)